MHERWRRRVHGPRDNRAAFTAATTAVARRAGTHLGRGPTLALAVRPRTRHPVASFVRTGGGFLAAYASLGGQQ
jgi:hypothetical protein